jgi:hypothetical protein
VDVLSALAIILICTFPNLERVVEMSYADLDRLDEGYAVVKKDRAGRYFTIKPDQDYWCKEKPRKDTGNGASDPAALGLFHTPISATYPREGAVRQQL